MAVVVGIDEAGYGPLLGPLVVSRFTMRIPDQLVKEDHWELLKNAVSSGKKNLKGRLLITDSKKAYNRKTGISHLQNTILSILAYLKYHPQSMFDLLNIVCPDCLERIVKYQWYEKLQDRKLDFNLQAVNLSASVLSKTLHSVKAEMLEMSSFCLDVGYFNGMVSKLNNKSAVLFMPISRFIADAFDSYGQSNLHIIVDRQGGRVNYARELMRMFEGLELSVIRENKLLSSYKLTDGRKQMKIHFAVKADIKHLPVCVSSMLSKYLRELMVGEINGYFSEFNKNLKPTAGYWTDGQRFLKDLKKHCPNVNFNQAMLIRNK